MEAAQMEGKHITAADWQPASSCCTGPRSHQAAALPPARHRCRHRHSAHTLKQTSSAGLACCCTAWGAARLPNLAIALATFSTGTVSGTSPRATFSRAQAGSLDHAAALLPKATGQPLCHEAPKAQALHTCPIAAQSSPSDQLTGCTGAAAPNTPLSRLQRQMAAPLQGGQLHRSPSLPRYLQAWSR